jgi:hypothetical protein
MKTPEQIAQWVISNRYPKSEQDKVSDHEMYHFILENINVLLEPVDWDSLKDFPMDEPI